MSLESEALYILSCDHLVMGKLSFGIMELECYSCKTKQTITDVHVWEWHTKCNTCPFSRWTGLSRKLSEWQGNEHYRRHPTHAIVVGYAKNPHAEKIRDRLIENKMINVRA